MAARLIQIAPPDRRASYRLDREQVLIGRDPEADISLESYSRISRRHVLVRALGRNHQLKDLGSSNGTLVNGVSLGEPVLLQPGDHIELGGEVTLVYEQTQGGYRKTLISLAVFCALALLGGAAWWWWLPPQVSIPEPSLRKAAEGLAAYRADDFAAAKEQLKSAAGDLYHLGLLDHVDRADVMKVAMQELASRLPQRPDLWSIFQETLEATRPRPPSTGRVIGGPRTDLETRVCRLDEVRGRDLDRCLQESIGWVFRELRQDPSDVPRDFHRQVGQRMRTEHKFLRQAFQRGKPLVPMLRSELEEMKMPPLLHYVACIESGYNASARSPAKAVGLWQFIPGTAKRYGLKVSQTRDDRLDVAKSTRAAAGYLNDLAMEFGGDALLLALASYNRGENGVRRALKTLPDPFADRSYWKLVDEGLLPAETALYVTRFISAAVAGEAGLPAHERLVEAGY